jgi:hypothetical protein
VAVNGGVTVMQQGRQQQMNIRGYTIVDEHGNEIGHMDEGDMEQDIDEEENIDDDEDFE